MLDRVGERLAGDEVGGGLDARRDALDRRVHLDRQRRAAGEIAEGGGEPVVEPRRAHPGGDLAQVGDRRADLRHDLVECGSEDLGPIGERTLQAPQLQPQRDEALLRAVVEVAFEPAALLVAGLDDSRARRVDLGELQPHLDPQPGDLDRERRRREHAVEQRPPLEQLRVVEEHTGAYAVAPDLRAGAAVLRQVRDELAGRVRVGPAPGRPEEQRRERIVQRVREHVPDLLGGASPLAHLVLERAHMPHALEPLAREATVDRALDGGAERAEHHRDRERGSGDRPVGAAAGEDAEDQRHGRVRTGEHQRQEGVDERAVDQPLDGVQAIAGNGDAHRRRDRRLHQQQEREQDDVEEMLEHEPLGGAEHESERDQRRRPCQPERLQPLDAGRALHAEADRERAAEQAGQDPDPEGDPDARVVEKLAEPIVQERIPDRGIRRVERRRVEQGERDEAREARGGRTGGPAPATTEQPPVRKDVGNGDRPGVEQRPGRAADLQRPAAADCLTGERPDHGRRSQQQDPADHVPRSAQDDGEPDRGGRQNRDGDEGRRHQRDRRDLAVAADDADEPEAGDHHQSRRRDRRAPGCAAESPHSGIIRAGFRIRNGG
jgi:hypothetical protein